MPASADFVHDVSESKRTASAGAPRPGWNVTVHGPDTVAIADRGPGAMVRCAAVVARRKTTNVEPYGSRSNGTSVRPRDVVYVAGVMSPVAASHKSAALPVTRKLAVTRSGRSC